MLELVPPAAVFPALADVLAGYLLVRFSGVGAGEPRLLPLLLVSTVCLHLGARLWRHVFGADRVGRQASERAVSAGPPAMTRAFLAATVLFFAAFLLAMTAGPVAFFLCAAMGGLFLLGEAGLRRVELLGPLANGVRRGMNVLFGMAAYSAVPILLGQRLLWVPPLLVAGYEVVLGVLATTARPPEPVFPPGEAAGTAERAADHGLDGPVVVLGMLALAAIALSAYWILPGRAHAAVLYGAAALLAVPGAVGWIRFRAERELLRMVRSGAVGLVLLQAGLVAAMTAKVPSRQEIAGVVLVAVLALPTLLLFRRMPPEGGRPWA